MALNYKKLLLLILVVTAISVAAVTLPKNSIGYLQNHINQLGAWGPLIFIMVYLIATVLFIPGSVLTLSAGVLFGPVAGTLYSLTGATLGATLAFLISRFIAYDWVREKSGGKISQIIQGVEEEGWRFIAFIRLVPLFPFNLVNYIFGLTRISVVSYFITSFICMLPGAAAYAYLGYVGAEAAAQSEQLIQKAIIAIALFACVMYLPYIVKRIRNKNNI